MKVLDQGLQPPDQLTEVDLVVIGAGGAGLAAALFAALEGASVLLVERTGFVGGTTAWSAGTSWIPCSHHEASVNLDDTLARTALYLDNAVGEGSARSNRQAFLDNGRAAVDQAEQQSALKYRPYPKHPDYISDLAGSTLNGRALEPVPFDGRLLGDLFRLLRPPIPEFTVLGGMMVDRTDINHLLAMTRNLASLKHSLSILLRHARDRLSWPRGTRLVMGNAHVARKEWREASTQYSIARRIDPRNEIYHSNYSYACLELAKKDVPGECSKWSSEAVSAALVEG
jgi:hypothetical protein